MRIYNHKAGFQLEPIKAIPPHWNPISFFQGLLQFNKQPIVYFLQKYIANDTEAQQIEKLNIDIRSTILKAHFAESKESTRPYQDIRQAEATFKKFNIPLEFLKISQVSRALAQAFYDQYARDAVVQVVGVVKNTHIDEHGFPISDVEVIPLEERSTIERLLKNQGLQGKVMFW